MGRTQVVIPEIRVTLGVAEQSVLRQLSQYPDWRHQKASSALRSLRRKGLVARKADPPEWQYDVSFRYRVTWRGHLVNDRLGKVQHMTPLELLADTHRG